MKNIMKKIMLVLVAISGMSVLTADTSADVNFLLHNIERSQELFYCYKVSRGAGSFLPFNARHGYIDKLDGLRTEINTQLSSYGMNGMRDASVYTYYRTLHEMLKEFSEQHRNQNAWPVAQDSVFDNIASYFKMHCGPRFRQRPFENWQEIIEYAQQEVSTLIAHLEVASEYDDLVCNSKAKFVGWWKHRFGKYGTVRYAISNVAYKTAPYAITAGTIAVVAYAAWKYYGQGGESSASVLEVDSGNAGSGVTINSTLKPWLNWRPSNS